MKGMTGLLDGLAHHRVRYADAGAAMRQAIDRATVAKVGPLVRSVLDAVLILTVSYSKLTDTTTYRQIAQIAYGRDDLHGRERERVREALHLLAELDVLEVTPCGTGRYARVVVSVPMATPSVAVAAMDTDSVAVDVDAVDSMATTDGVNGHAATTPMATPGVAHLEDLEVSSESSFEFLVSKSPRPPERAVSCDRCRDTKRACTDCQEQIDALSVTAS